MAWFGLVVTTVIVKMVMQPRRRAQQKKAPLCHQNCGRQVIDYDQPFPLTVFSSFLAPFFHIHLYLSLLSLSLLFLSLPLLFLKYTDAAIVPELNIDFDKVCSAADHFQRSLLLQSLSRHSTPSPALAISFVIILLIPL